MDPQKQRIMQLVPAIRMMGSAPNSIKSGSFVPLDQLSETDPEKIAGRLGRGVTVLEGPEDRYLHQLEKIGQEAGEYIFLAELGLVGLSNNQSKIEQRLATVRKKGRGADLPEAVAPPQIRRPLYNRVVAVTGAAMGFGEGIARQLFSEGCNIAVMDINQEAGYSLARELNRSTSANRAWFVNTDVSSAESVLNAVYETVLEFGGLDVMISNAGVLMAGGIDEIKEESFDFVRRVNYDGYYHCVKAAAPVMKQQNHYAPWNYGDIIQINSKSGLTGSRKNFAYAGSKFAGIGLTQSFALELMPDRIKVNAICPGNYFEGPLWSDPEKGLFIQYLRAGKVPGAKTIEDVKRHYESMVPAGRGCRIEDVVRAIRYVIEQEYETGQAVPVTGGQVMLG